MFPSTLFKDIPCPESQSCTRGVFCHFRHEASDYELDWEDEEDEEDEEDQVEDVGVHPQHNIPFRNQTQSVPNTLKGQSLTLPPNNNINNNKRKRNIHSLITNQQKLSKLSPSNPSYQNLRPQLQQPQQHPQQLQQLQQKKKLQKTLLHDPRLPSKAPPQSNMRNIKPQDEGPGGGPLLPILTSSSEDLQVNFELGESHIPHKVRIKFLKHVLTLHLQHGHSQSSAQALSRAIENDLLKRSDSKASYMSLAAKTLIKVAQSLKPPSPPKPKQALKSCLKTSTSKPTNVPLPSNTSVNVATNPNISPRTPIGFGNSSSTLKELNLGIGNSCYSVSPGNQPGSVDKTSVSLIDDNNPSQLYLPAPNITFQSQLTESFENQNQ
jgi:hypothetical protein